MPTYKASEVVAKWSFKPDKNMPRVVAKACNSISKMYEKMIKDMEKKQKTTVKSYEKMLKGMQKKQKDSVKDSKKETNLILNQYLDMFKKVKDGSKALDLKSMTNPINGAVGIMSRFTGMLKEMQERTKNIVAEASSHEFYASRLGVSSSSLQAFERLGLDYKIEKGEIRGVLEGVQSSIMKMRRGEGDEMTSLLSMMGVSSEDNSADAFNKVLGWIATRDERQQEIFLNKLGINDQAIRPFIELLASYKDNNNPTEKYREQAFEDKVVKSAYQADLDVKDAEAKSSKEFLSEEKIESFTSNTVSKITLQNARQELMEPILMELEQLETQITEGMAKEASNIKKSIDDSGNVLEGIFNWLKGLIGIDNITTSIANSVGTAVDKAFGTIKTTFEGISTGMSYSMYTMGNAMKGFFTMSKTPTLSQKEWELQRAKGKDPLELTDREIELMKEEERRRLEAREVEVKMRSEAEEALGTTLPELKPSFMPKESVLVDEKSLED